MRPLLFALLAVVVVILAARMRNQGGARSAGNAARPMDGTPVTTGQGMPDAWMGVEPVAAPQPLPAPVDGAGQAPATATQWQADAEDEDALMELDQDARRSGETKNAAEPDSDGTATRRVSAFLEIRDGGYGVGSAAPIHDGAQPMDHPVKAFRSTMTFLDPADPGYESAEPDVWFYDGPAAERAGFSGVQD